MIIFLVTILRPLFYLTKRLFLLLLHRTVKANYSFRTNTTKQIFWLTFFGKYKTKNVQFEVVNLFFVLNTKYAISLFTCRYKYKRIVLKIYIYIFRFLQTTKKLFDFFSSSNFEYILAV